MIVLPPTFGSEGPSALVDWFARMLVVELAIAAVAAGTFPIVRRGAISAGELAARVGLPSRPDRIRRALREAFAAGLLLRLSADETEIRVLALCSGPDPKKAPPCIPPVSVASDPDPDPDLAHTANPDLQSAYVSVAGESEAVSGKGKGKVSPIPPTPRDGEVAVFAAWCKSFAKKKTTKLDAARLRAIRKALLPGSRGLGFAEADLLAAIRGYARDPWRRELPVRHELATLLRNAAQIETGIELGQMAGPIRRPDVPRPAAGDDVDEARGEAAARRAPAARGGARASGGRATLPPERRSVSRPVSGPFPGVSFCEAEELGFEELPT